MLSGSFITVYVSRATAPAPCASLRRPRGRLAPELLADELAGPQDLHQVDARFYSQTVEHVDHVFGRDIARSALGVGAAAEARHRAVEGSHARLERGVNVRERLPVGVVVMTAELGRRDLFR